MFFETSLESFLGAPTDEHVPIVRERPADMITPVGAAARLFRSGEASFLLESAEGGETVGRFSLVGVNATSSIGRDGEDLVALRAFLDAHRVADTPHPPALPASAVGYLSYDAIRHWEAIPQRHGAARIPPYLFVHFQDLLVFDHLKQRLYIITLAPPSAERDESAYLGCQTRLNELESQLAAPVTLPPVTPEPEGTETTVTPSASVFEDKVRQAKEYIASGDVFQVVISRTFERPFVGDPLHLYRSLRMINPSPYMFYLDMGDHQIIGASPEDLVRVQGTRVETLPIAGTRRRGVDDAEDEALSRELCADPKECAEHTMLVDLARNDIGRISEPGSVKVERMMEVEKFSHVIHMVSRVAGRMRDDFDALDGLCACFPAGTVSGAPKIRAMEIIDELEHRSRGLYAGAVGYFDGRGNLDTCIAIRTLVLQDGVARVTAGAGIVADSQPDKEEEETRSKARAVLTALEWAGRLP